MSDELCLVQERGAGSPTIEACRYVMHSRPPMSAVAWAHNSTRSRHLMPRIRAPTCSGASNITHSKLYRPRCQ